jgi:hypothetical protein
MQFRSQSTKQDFMIGPILIPGIGAMMISVHSDLSKDRVFLQAVVAVGALPLFDRYFGRLPLN